MGKSINLNFGSKHLQTWTFCSMSVLGGDRQNCISPILAPVILLGPPATLATWNWKVNCDFGIKYFFRLYEKRKKKQIENWKTFWASTSPSTNSESSIVPPSFLTIRMSFRSTWNESKIFLKNYKDKIFTPSSPVRPALTVEWSVTLKTACAAIGAKRSEDCDTTFELREVDAAWGWKCIIECWLLGIDIVTEIVPIKWK